MNVVEIPKPASGARVIAQQIKIAIESKQFRDGEQLPTERELAESYSASRSTIRNALDTLEREGLLTRKVGSGTFVNYIAPSDNEVVDVVDQISPIQLIDARIGFERQMARLAVLHATKRDTDQMSEVLDQMFLSNEDPDEFTRLDSEFHMALAKATGNPLMVHLYEQINEVRTHKQWRAIKNIVLTPKQIDEYNRFHEKILGAIRDRDAAAAIEALNGHMDLAKKDLVGAEENL
ncbi:MAG: FadR/GntR family transcriptional regulator [Pseudomonadota bacterium]